MEIRRPLLWIVVAWLCGMAVASRFEAVWIAIGGAASGGVVLAWAGGQRRKNAMTAFAVAVAFAVGGAWFERYDAGNDTSIPLSDEAEESVLISGILRTKPETDGDRASFELAADRWTVRGVSYPLSGEVVKVNLYFDTEAERGLASSWSRGDRATVSGTIRKAMQATNFGGFDYREYLRRQRIHWTVAAEGMTSVERLPPTEWSVPRALSYIDRVRDDMGKRIEAQYEEPVAGFMKGLVLGLREDLDPVNYQAFSQVGLTHILAISGLNVAIYVGAILWGLGRLPITREARLVAAIAAVPVYVALTGASPSVVRAGIMAMIALYAARRRLLKDGMNVLAAAALVMTAWNPYFLYDISFQLSFAVTAGIILGTPLMNRIVRIGRPALQSAVSVTVVAQCVSFPLTVTYFNTFNLLSFPANFAIVPLFSLAIMPIGSIAMLLAYVWPVGATALAYVAEKLTSLSFGVVGWLSTFDGAASIWPTPPLWWIGAYYATLFAALAAAADRIPAPRTIAGRLSRLLQRRSVLVSASLALYGIALLYAYAPTAFERSAVVSFLDVGQGDAILVRTPFGKHMLIDGGGTIRFAKPGEEWKIRSDPFEVGADVVVPLLRKRGVQSIDALFVSHADTDHIGGLQAVVESIPVRRVFFNGTAKEGETSERLLRTIVSKRIPLTAAYEGMVIRVDAATELRVLFPERAPGGELEIRKEQNELSVVMLMTVYGRTFLFTGDIGAAEEAAIAEALRERSVAAPAASVSTAPRSSPLPRIDVLKVAHHGSKTSTTDEWLEATKPGIAVVSAGRNNIYGHPHPTVTVRLQEAGIMTLRTDWNGEVQFRITPEGWAARTKLKP